VCDGPTQPDFVHCFCCTVLIGQLGQPLAPVTAVTPYRVGDGVHRLLRGYKDAPLAEERAAATARLVDLVRRWLAATGGRRLHARAGGGWAMVVGVPSSRRPGPAPVDALIRAVPELARLHRPLLRRGLRSTDHLVASRQGFSVPPANRYRRGDPRGPVLVVDDTYATGARAHSAVAALEVAGVLVVGRVVDPTATPWQGAYWEASQSERRVGRPDPVRRPGR
jgi:hypothetical protein